MRKLLFSTFLFGILLLSGCGGYIVEYYPVTLYVRVMDASRHDLLDPDSEYFLGTDITMEYDGKVEHLKPLESAKDVLVIYNGLELIQKDGVYMLAFGELDGGNRYDDDFIITWPDGSYDKIHYKRSFGSKRNIEVKEVWKLNGKETSNPVVIIK